MENSRLDKVLDAVGRPLVSRRSPTAISTWVPAVLIAAALGVIWVLTYLAGGTQTALPHALYLPIVLAGAAFGLGGAVVTALVATLLIGPLMPLDVAAGLAQSPAGWSTRGAIFVLVAVTVGGLFTATRRAYTASLEAHLSHDLAAPEPLAAASSETIRRVRDVLERRCFHPVYQPIYALADGRLRAVEALTRFDTEHREGPDVWFGMARQAGLEVELDLATIEAALRVADAEIPSEVELSLNCSPATICDARLLALLDRFPRRAIILEITEHAVVDDYHQLELTMYDLRARGISLAVDDTGAGFANLRHVLRLAPEIIKLDLSLTQGLRHDPVRRTLAECLVRFASRTGSELVAEGIEDHADLAAWRELGADAAQGYLLGRPGSTPLAAVSALLIHGHVPLGSGEALRAT